MAELLLGIDIGTYSAKGVLVDLAGEVVAQHVVEHDLDLPKPGWAEHDPERVWWGGVVRLCRALLDGRYRGGDVAAVGVSAIGPCLLPLDDQGNPLRKGILYGIDTRATRQIAELQRRIPREELLRHAGSDFTSQAVGPKILWLRQEEPEVWRRTRYLSTASSYLVYRLTGEHVMDRHTASHYLPLINIGSLEWSDTYADLVAPLELLPRLAWSDERAGEVDAKAAAETGLEPGTPVAVGTVDALAEALSVGVMEPGELMIMYGSTTFFILVLETPVRDPRVWLTAGAFHDQYVLAAGMATTGSLTRWFRDTLARDLPLERAYDELFEAAARVRPGAEGLITLPYFSGERTPINDPRARGVIAGLTLTHTREELFRSVLEGVAYGIRHNLETFEALGAPVRRATAVGGGAKTDTWLQIVSDAASLSQEVPRRTIGASYGDAFLAGLAAGKLSRRDLSAWVGEKRIIHPNPKHAPLYEEAYRDFRALYESIAPILHRLAQRGATNE